ncbi:MAG TPA: ATP-grasp domain-containing protein [Gemmatimonadota bacterium]|nr:ATP-grasp domain-containing protein [Gemmatimonadota bacterium]
MKVIVLHDTERDEVVNEVCAAVRSIGHEALTVAFGDDVVMIATRLRDEAPDLVFNLTESFAGKSALDSGIASLLNLLHLRYTGSSHSGLLLAGDKVLAKRILSFHGIRTPEFAVLHRGALENAEELRFPVIVKPPQEDASIGITAASVAHDVNELLARVGEIQRQHGGPILVERFIEGREFYVGVLGNEQAEALPPAELDMSAFPDGVPRVATWSAKWEADDEAASGRTVFPDGLDPGVSDRMREAAVAAFRALRLRDYARVDIRLDGGGEPFVLEVNPNCYLARGEVFAEAAERTGLSYEALIGRILELAASRYAR